jgi:uncharacterized protein with PQ loop repeat
LPTESIEGRRHMTGSQLIGVAATLYGFGASLAILLQARQLLQRGTSCDVSARFFGTYVGGYALWLVYGMTIGSLPIILVHSVGLASGALTLAVALALRGSLWRPATWNRCQLDPSALDTKPAPTTTTQQV